MKPFIVVVLVLIISNSLFAKEDTERPLANYYLTGRFSEEKCPFYPGCLQTADFYLYKNLIYLWAGSEAFYLKQFPNGSHILETHNGTKIRLSTKDGTVERLEVLSPIEQFKNNETELVDDCLIGEFYVQYLSSKDTHQQENYYQIKDENGICSYCNANILAIFKDSEGVTRAALLDFHGGRRLPYGEYFFRIENKEAVVVDLEKDNAGADLFIVNCRVRHYNKRILEWLN